MMEKEKKTRTVKKPSVTELTATEPKKTTSKKKASPGVVSVLNGSAPSANGSVAKTNGSALKKAAPRKSAVPELTAMNVSHEEIARLAHRYWAERGHQHGHHEEDWLRAERELIGKAS